MFTILGLVVLAAVMLVVIGLVMHAMFDSPIFCMYMLLSDGLSGLAELLLAIIQAIGEAVGML